MTAWRMSWPATVAASAVVAAAVVAADAPAAARAPVVLVFAALGPGLAFVPLLGLRDPVAELTLALAVSLSLDVALGSAMAYARMWSPDAAIGILAALALCGAALQLRQERARSA